MAPVSCAALRCGPGWTSLGFSVLTFQRRYGEGRGSDGKESAFDAGDQGSIPGLGRSPGEGKWLPTPVFVLGESHGQRSLMGYSPRGRKESDTTEWLTHTWWGVMRSSRPRHLEALLVVFSWAISYNLWDVSSLTSDGTQAANERFQVLQLKTDSAKNKVN